MKKLLFGVCLLGLSLASISQPIRSSSVNMVNIATKNSTTVFSNANNVIYRYIRNNHTTAEIFLAFNVSAQKSKGIKLKAGEIYEINDLNLSKANINAIASPNIVPVSVLTGTY